MIMRIMIIVNITHLLLYMYIQLYSIRIYSTGFFQLESSGAYIYIYIYSLLSVRLLSWLELLWRTSTAIYCDLTRTQIISLLRYQTHSEASFRRNVCSIQFIEYYVRVVEVMTSWLVDASTLFMLLKEGATHFLSFSQHDKCVYIYTQYTYWQYIYIHIHIKFSDLVILLSSSLRRTCLELM
jgi:hypothetical protein